MSWVGIYRKGEILDSRLEVYLLSPVLCAGVSSVNCAGDCIYSGGNLSNI